MKAHDFKYGERTLSSFGFIICRFDSGGLETIDGVEISFNTVSTLNGQKHNLISSSYEDCLECVFQICKNPCGNDNMEISPIVFREISKWLLRKRFLHFKLMSNESIDLYYEAAFTKISRIEIDGKLVGLELTLVTNAPFAYKDKKNIAIKNLEKDGRHSIHDTSHEEGYIYPIMEVIVNESGDLSIYNAIEDRTTLIKNCVAGEVITMDYPVIQSSVSSHNIQNDFNWNFFRVANTFDNSRNDLTISLPCTIKITYSPIVKVGL